MCLYSMFVPLNRQDPRDYFNTHRAGLSGSHNLLYTHFVRNKIFVPFLVINLVFVTFMHGFMFPLCVIVSIVQFSFRVLVFCLCAIYS